MKRRTFLATGAASLAPVAGCLGQGGGGGGDDTTTPWSGYGQYTPTDGNTDGYPPAFDQQPSERSIDTDSFETVEEGGVQVPLAPIEATGYWYRRGEARFADARGPGSYEAAHVYGAVLSPAPERYRTSNDPLNEWPKDDRIVCYCGCPHHLSSIRASQLINEGYENVYVIDEGFGEWRSQGYAMAGTDVGNPPKKWTIRGETAADLAGENAWARHRPTEQVESTDIAADGSYELHLKFHGVDSDSTIEVETPGYTVEGKLQDLTAGTVQG
ncbi:MULTISPECIES: rhodanese-like domain-containing protein [Halorussus]|uniref:rhodanese-like domain-containing protein n=1 Tax=Halorussus TaxID=1070314 RepID=UPI000E215B94|nr:MULTISPECIES: rhodanese-like domain-containing protein [Halorussus]NHN58765.1 rhodanese-like domain-containing protein [Halorussus sp. JP-T4]